MTEETETTTTETTTGEELPCFIRHLDAGGQCEEPGAVQVHGLNFFEAHGEEALIGAGLEAYDDANWFFERFRNPHVPQQGDGIERALGFALARLREEAPSDSDHQRALVAAYPEIPVETRRQLVNWQIDEEPGYAAVVDTLLDNLHTIHKLLRITHAVKDMTWLVEVLEEERQSLAAQAAYVLRNPSPPEGSPADLLT